MADERIEVEWIATATKMVQVLANLENKMDKQEKQLQKIADTSKKGAEAAAGSFNKLEQELKEAEAALKKMAMGTAEFEKQKRKVDELRTSLKGAKGAIADTGGQVSAALGGAVAKVAQLAAGMLSFQTIVAGITAELEKIKAMKVAAAESTKTFEQAVAAMALNVGAADMGRAQQMILANAPGLGVSPQGMANLLSSAISGGAADLDEALKLTTATLKLTAGNAEAAAPIMSGMLSLARATGQKDFTASLGQLAQFQKAARGEDLAVSINNMSTALAAANTRGERMAPLGSERTLEVASTISQILQDPRMAVSGTALRQMVTKLDAFIPKEKVTLDDGTVSKLTKEQIAGFNQLGTFDERIAAMRATPELGKQFLSTIEQSEGKVAIRQIVQGSEAVRELEKAAAATITSLVGGQTEFDNLTAKIAEATTLTRIANQAEAQRQVGRIQDPARAIEGQILQEVERTIAEVNLTGIDAMREMEVNAGLALAQEQKKPVGPVAVEMLQALQQQVRIPGIGIPLGAAPSAEDRERLQQAIDKITELNARQLALLERQIQAEQQRVRPAPPMARRPQDAPLPAVGVP